MAVIERKEKRQLVIDLGKDEMPTAWRWKVVQFLSYEDGSEAAPPRTVEIPTTAEEVSAHIGETVVKQAKDIADDKVAYEASLTALTAERDVARAKLALATEALNAVTAADQSWDEAVRVKVIAALQ
jgi:hypothetical protein